MSMPASGVESGHAVLLAFRLLARFFPYQRPPGTEHVTLEQLSARFKRWEWRIVVLLFVFAVPSVLLAKLGLALVLPLPPPPPGALMHLTIDPAFFILPALFLGIIVTSVPITLVLWLCLGGDYPDFILMGNLRTGFDTVKVWTSLAVVVAAGALALAAAAAPVHLTVFGDRIEVRHFGSIHALVIPAAEYRSASIRPNGPLTLTFANGTTWSSTDDLSLIALSPAQKRQLLALVGHRP